MKSWLILFVLALALTSVTCAKKEQREQTFFEDTGKKMDEGLRKTGDEIDKGLNKAGEEIQKGLDQAGDKVKDATE